MAATQNMKRQSQTVAVRASSFEILITNLVHRASRFTDRLVSSRLDSILNIYENQCDAVKCRRYLSED